MNFNEMNYYMQGFNDGDIEAKVDKIDAPLIVYGTTRYSDYSNSTSDPRSEYNIGLRERSIVAYHARKLDYKLKRMFPLKSLIACFFRPSYEYQWVRCGKMIQDIDYIAIVYDNNKKVAAKYI